MARTWWDRLGQMRRLIRALEGLQMEVAGIRAALDRAVPVPPPAPTAAEIGLVDTFDPRLAPRIDDIAAEFLASIGRAPTDEELEQRLTDEGTLR